MNRRSFLSTLVVAPVFVALTACSGSDSKTNPTSPPPSDVSTPAAPSTGGIGHPTGANDVVMKLSYEGGFVPADTAFINTPALLVSGDGKVYTPGVDPAISPGPLLPNIVVRTITEDGIQRLLGIVEHAGLMTDLPDYSGGKGVADAPNTILTIHAANGSFVHSAYALGADTPESRARQTLLDTVNAIADLEKATGSDNLGENQPYVPTVYRLRATVADPSVLTQTNPAPSVVDWPSGAAAPLTGATTCARLDAAVIGSLFTDATQNTYFKDSGVVYKVAVAGVLPGDPDC